MHACVALDTVDVPAAVPAALASAVVWFALGWYSRAASLLPVTAPFAMPVRIAVGEVPVWEIMLAAAIMIAATYGLVRLGGAVYSGSLLRTGGRPRLRDLWSATRYARGRP